MKRILVIDDEMQIRELLRKVLSAEGFQVDTAPSAAQGIEDVFHEPYDFVILDLKLGGESGLDVLKKIRASNAKIPVIIHSGAITADIEKEARAAGASDVVSKSVGIATLTVQIRNFLAASERLTTGALPRKEKRILLVDDEAVVRSVLKEYFQQKGYSISEAKSGEEALETAAREDVSVVLLDMQMTGMDGLETLEKLLRLKPGLGVVMATGVQNDEKVARALELGAYGYVLKPFDFMYLELVVLSKLALAQS